ncbi:MAG: YmdB family metallophosphoesterase [Bacilli bacterium]|nr:YmdB family metallophosphoesterase [Bacilli bacterium]
MKILFFGDIVGNRGMTAVSDVLPFLAKRYEADLIIANGENASQGFGLTHRDCLALKDMGVDVITLGNHWRTRKSIDDDLEAIDTLVRPHNVRDYDLGQGYVSLDVNGVPVTVSNLLGTAFMKEEVNSPSASMHEILDEAPEGVHIVDYHAESTSEKSLFAHYFDGMVSAVLGTHTHVQTADARILPQGTGFISDVGMCGAYESVIGFEPQSVIDRIYFNGPNPMRVDDEAEAMVNAVLLDIDEQTYLCKAITPLVYVNGKERIHG